MGTGRDPEGEHGERAEPWLDLAADYEKARVREDSLDTLVEWPAQRRLLGDVRGLSLLDLGCGNGGKLAELARDGAEQSVGVDLSGAFPRTPPAGVEYVSGDLNELDSFSAVAGRVFDRVLFLQSFGYARDPVAVLSDARRRLSPEGFILLTRTHPIRYAVERAAQNGTSLGEEYFSGGSFSYTSAWNAKVSLTKRAYTISDLLNIISAAGLWIEIAEEPQLSDQARREFPHKEAWMNKHLGILIFRLRPLPSPV